MATHKRNDIVTLSRTIHNIWLKRTPEELQQLRNVDIANGRFHDDAGEPILYGNYDGWNGVETDTIEVMVTNLRPNNWTHWNRRPKGLMAGWSQKLDREVLFTIK